FGFFAWRWRGCLIDRRIQRTAISLGVAVAVIHWQFLEYWRPSSRQLADYRWPASRLRQPARTWQLRRCAGRRLLESAGIEDGVSCLRPVCGLRRRYAAAHQ